MDCGEPTSTGNQATSAKEPVTPTVGCTTPAASSSTATGAVAAIHSRPDHTTSRIARILGSADGNTPTTFRSHC